MSYITLHLQLQKNKCKKIYTNVVMEMKKQGTKEFSIIDAFSILKNNKFLIECNYCDFFADDEEQALQHYDDCHKDIRDKSYPRTYLDKFSGKKWFIPKFETIEHSKYMLDDIHFYLKFYGSCLYEEQSLTSSELKNVHMNSTNNHYFYKEDNLWDIESQQKQKSAKKQPKEPPVVPQQNNSTIMSHEELVKEFLALRERVNRMASQPKSAFSPKKEWRIYSLNVGESKVEDSKNIIKSRYNIPDDLIRIKKNRFGNYSIFYKPKPQEQKP
jgi:hypothetical protein